jgi:excisionase family DNA binding protein
MTELTQTERIAYSADETARMLGLEPWTVRRLLRDGRLHGTRFGNRWIVSRAAIDQFLGIPSDDT